MHIRPADLADAARVVAIYNYYIETSHATFEIEPVSAGEMENRMRGISRGGYPFLVCENEGEIVGYAYGQPYKSRAAYRHSTEVSVYIRNGFGGQGIGKMLYDRLFPEIFKGDYHAIVAGVSLPNDASVRLHEAYGFEKVAHFREVGFKFGRWIDVGYWELLVP